MKRSLYGNNFDAPPEEEGCWLEPVGMDDDVGGAVSGVGFSGEFRRRELSPLKWWTPSVSRDE